MWLGGRLGGQGGAGLLFGLEPHEEGPGGVGVGKQAGTLAKFEDERYGLEDACVGVGGRRYGTGGCLRGARG